MRRKYSEAQAKLNLIVIVRHRFRLFEAKFQRQPEPNEPIFFDESSDSPVQASQDTARRQLAEAALATGVDLEPVLKFLGFSPIIAVVAVLGLLQDQPQAFSAMAAGIR